MLALILFILTYAALAAGRVPLLALDRTGIALVGAAAFLATRQLSLDQALAAVDAPTLIILFGMMLLSAQYEHAGLYERIVAWLSGVQSPRRLLLAMVGVTAGLSALLTNDVICFALTPLLLRVCRRAGLPPSPYLLAIACASNIGSALTPIGNPQNMLIANRMGLALAPFAAACALPVMASLGALYALLRRQVPSRSAAVPPAPGEGVASHAGNAFGARKAIASTLGVVALLLSPLPSYLAGVALVGVTLTTRRQKTADTLRHVDWGLLCLFLGLFTVMAGFEAAGWAQALSTGLGAWGLDVDKPMILAPLVATLSNLISNVPAVMLLLPLVQKTQATGYLLALASTFAGNAVIVGSIANLIVVEQARRAGVPISFWEHARVGLPVTVASLLACTLMLSFP
ncbi:MAG TPA: SLC13 family permease [Myxococcota bacterium]|nr:SLC13 family permease [Myxococcota bacterium]